jgi:3-phosphoshikimate 1-carboxyvinyltransferase
MHERPQAALFHALRELGYRIDSPNDKLPAAIHGDGVRPGKCRVSIEESSQFASALLLCSLKGSWTIEVVGQSAEESPYIKMTDSLLAIFPHRGGVFSVEADASSGSYFLAAQQFLSASTSTDHSGTAVPLDIPPEVSVVRWPKSGWQVDERFSEVLANTPTLRNAFGFRNNPPLGSNLARSSQDVEGSIISRSRDLGDSIMMLVVMAPFATDSIRFTDLGRLRLQECERVVALRSELTKCGARILEEGDTLTVYPSQLHGAEIETYNDHRMAMCFAILGLKVPGIRIKNPACVKKTFPNFFQKLAAPPPQGLGASLRDAHTGRNLGLEELFAT